MSRVASASPGIPRRHGGTPRASSGFIPPPKLPLALVPPGAVLRAPGALPKPGRMSRLLRGRCGRWGWFWSRGGVCGEVLLLERVLRAAWRALDV